MGKPADTFVNNCTEKQQECYIPSAEQVILNKKGKKCVKYCTSATIICKQHYKNQKEISFSIDYLFMH